MKILIVDNDMALLKSLEILLSEQGHRVTCFSDPETACCYVAAEPDVDVMFVDYSMGEMNGQDMLIAMGGARKVGCKAIMITGHKEQIQSYKILDALGVRCVLSKPLDLSDLLEVIG